MYRCKSITILIRYNIAKSDLKSGVDISDMATTRIQEIHSDPIIRIINTVYPFEYEKHKSEYENKVKELKAEIKALTDKKLVEITNLHELLNEEQKE